ncbi:FecR family protein [Acinetobacter bereziniae]|uniref:FecR family protein n=1 Tax=Acinetobacter bereziniae TaxID=106648 RepID=UPI00124F7ADD|nr:FecR domain-containing protein [Acinetobacter bereziniae]
MPKQTASEEHQNQPTEQNQDKQQTQQILNEAADWSMRLSQEELSPQQLEQLQAWQQQSSLHAKVWKKVQQLNHTFGQLPTEVARPILNQTKSFSSRKRSHYMWILLCLPLLCLLGYSLNQQQQWTAEYRTKVGEIEKIKLPDGGELYLDSASAIDLDYNDKQRNVVLKKGQIWIKTAKDQQHRPFYVRTQHGQMQALGTEFSVELDPQRSWVVVEQGAVKVQPKHQLSHTIIAVAGQQSHFNREQVLDLTRSDLSHNSWTKGWIIANDITLSEFIQQIERYQKGHIALDDDIAQIKISGTYPINDLPMLYSMLALTYGLDINRYANGYWLSIHAKK